MKVISRFSLLGIKQMTFPKILNLFLTIKRFNQTQKFQAPALCKFPTAELSSLENGLKIVSQTTDCPIATVGVWIETGSRYEDKTTRASSTFLDHLFFKGTANTSQNEFENEAELIGAQFEAYTKREETAIFSKCFTKDISKVVKMVSDVVQNFEISDENVEHNRSSVLSELGSITENDIKQVLFDHLHSVAYQETNLSFSPLGSTNDIKNLKAYHIRNYLKQNLKSSHMILACAGGLCQDGLLELGCHYFNHIPNSFNDIPRIVPKCYYTGSEIRVRDDDMLLAHIAIAVEGPGYKDEDNLILELAKTIIGSWNETQAGGSNNASNLARYSFNENLCRYFESFNISYLETGLWGIYFVCDPLQCELMLYNIQKEWLRLCTMPIESELERAKEIYKTQLFLSFGNKTQICEAIAIQGLRSCRIKSLYELVNEIDSISIEDLRSVCYKYVYDNCPVVCAIGPIENLPDYNRIRSSMYWFRV